MRLAVLSDTHDNIWRLEAILPALQSADAILHCGDLCSPFILDRLARANQPVHIVWGNNEGDVRLMCLKLANYPQIKLHGVLAELTFDGVRVAINHYPEIAHGLALSGKYDLVCYGHDHRAHYSRVGECDLLNPGEMHGLLGKCSFAWYDTTTHTAEFVSVD